MTTEIYVSTDIEADGPIPGPNSMLSFASAAYNDLPHTHVALDDALGQGALFCNMLREARGRGQTS